MSSNATSAFISLLVAAGVALMAELAEAVVVHDDADADDAVVTTCLSKRAVAVSRVVGVMVARFWLGGTTTRIAA